MVEKIKILRLYFIIVFSAMVILSCGLFLSVESAAPTHPTLSINIPQGFTDSQIAQLLYQKHVIKNIFWFKLYAKLHGGTLDSGLYTIHNGEDMYHIFSAIQSGETSEIKVTIPEGFTVLQIADLLQSDHLVSTHSFLQEVQYGRFNLSFVLPQHTIYRLEGFLFPDTYEFYRGESAHTIIQTMLSQFESELTPRFLTDLKKQRIDIAQAVTIASIAEKEATLSSERPLIVSVIENRLRINMPLQMDSTVRYVTGWQQPLTNQDLRIHNPYNTYVFRGLPPGPIDNPGLVSLWAAVNPARTNYLYYVAKENGTDSQYFAVTYAQQLQNIQKSNQNQNHLVR